MAEPARTRGPSPFRRGGGAAPAREVTGPGGETGERTDGGPLLPSGFRSAGIRRDRESRGPELSA